MSEKAPQLNPEDKLTVTRATDDSLRYFKYDDNGKKQRIKNVDHDAILDHYGYSARSIEDVAAPIDVASTNEASVSTDDVAAPMASTDINPSAAYNQAVAEAEALRGGHMKNMASEKLRADIWEGRMKEAAPLFEIVMPAREKQAKDPNYHFTAEEAEAVGQLEEINLQGKASPKHKLEPITEDDYRYYKAGQEATSEEASTTESTTNNTWDAPDPSTANKDIPAPTDKPLPVHEPHPPVPVGEKPLELPKLPSSAQDRTKRDKEDAKKYVQVPKPPEATKPNDGDDGSDKTPAVIPVPIDSSDSSEKKLKGWKKWLAIGAVAVGAVIGLASLNNGDTAPKSHGDQDRKEVPEEAPDSESPDEDQDQEDNVGIAPFEIENGHGYTQEIQDFAPGYNPEEYLSAHNAAVAEFGSDYIVTEGGSYVDQGELRIAAPGKGHWKIPAVAEFIQNYLQANHS